MYACMRTYICILPCLPSTRTLTPPPAPQHPHPCSHTADGFPVLEGNAEQVTGKNFEIRKICARQLTDAQRTSIREFCQVRDRGVVWAGE